MNFHIAIVWVLLTLMGCGSGHRGTSKCATQLHYVTNRFTSGLEALRHTSEYRANIMMGARDFTVEAIVDTASANFVVNEKNFDYGNDTSTGKKPYIFDNSYHQSIAFNAKDTMDVACLADFSARFSLTSQAKVTPNYLGLAYNDPIHHPHEQKNVSFFDQLVKNEGFNNAFSLALCGQRGNSKMVLGGIDERMKPLIRNFIPIIEKTAYVVPALTLRRADNKTLLGEFPFYNKNEKTGVRTIIDSASSFLMLPSDMAITLAKEIEREAEILGLIDSFPEGFFRTERFNSTKAVRFADQRQIRQFPTLEIVFLGNDGKPKALEIPALRYLKEMDKDPLLRVFAVREASHSRDVVLGQPFLESHYTYFDRKNSRIGFGNIDIACVD